MEERKEGKPAYQVVNLNNNFVPRMRNVALPTCSLPLTKPGCFRGMNNFSATQYREQAYSNDRLFRNRDLLFRGGRRVLVAGRLKATIHTGEPAGR